MRKKSRFLYKCAKNTFIKCAKKIVMSLMFLPKKKFRKLNKLNAEFQHECGWSIRYKGKLIVLGAATFCSSCSWMKNYANDVQFWVYINNITKKKKKMSLKIMKIYNK